MEGGEQRRTPYSSYKPDAILFSCFILPNRCKLIRGPQCGREQYLHLQNVISAQTRRQVCTRSLVLPRRVKTTSGRPVVATQ